MSPDWAQYRERFTWDDVEALNRYAGAIRQAFLAHWDGLDVAKSHAEEVRVIATSVAKLLDGAADVRFSPQQRETVQRAARGLISGSYATSQDPRVLPAVQQDAQRRVELGERLRDIAERMRRHSAEQEPS